MVVWQWRAGNDHERFIARSTSCESEDDELAMQRKSLERKRVERGNRCEGEAAVIYNSPVLFTWKRNEIETDRRM